MRRGGELSARDWSEDVYRTLKRAEIRQVTYVPDAGHARLITLCHDDPDLRTVTLTSEEEGVGMACGAWLGGDRSVVLMQSSGVGKVVNALGMVAACRFPWLAIVTMRGEWGEFNPWQLPMGQAAPDVLARMGVIVQRVDAAEEAAPAVGAAARLAFDGGAAVAVLLSQRVLGAKEFTR